MPRPFSCVFARSLRISFLCSKKLALAQRINVENIALLVRADVHAFDEGFVVLDENIGILEIGVAGAHGFDFGAFEAMPASKVSRMK